MLLRAEDFARRLKKEAGDGTADQVRIAWRFAFGRDPLPGELETSTAFIESQTTKRSQPGKSSDLALADFCQMIFAMNEFVYVD